MSKVGSGSRDTSYKTVSYKDQKLAIHKFKKGEKNCLFATSVAEEGLDIPDCNIVIRYDLYRSMIQYIQSRGRARHADSEYIRMIESENAEQQRTVDQHRLHESILRRFCEALPGDRKLMGNGLDMEYFLRKEKGQKKFTVPETGATLTYSSAIGCLATFTARIPTISAEALVPRYSVIGVPSGFQCEVSMPAGSPVANAMGKAHTSKQAAKCSAAFEMCVKLYQKDYLDSHLQPIYAKKLPLLRNAHLAISSKKQEEYEMRTKPAMWSNLGGPGRLFITALTLDKPEALDWPSRPILLLTRQPLPSMNSFPLYFAKGRSSTARCVPVSASITVDEAALAKLGDFTLRVFRDTFSKEYEAAPSELPYFLAPSRLGHEFGYTGHIDPLELFDWVSLDSIRGMNAISWTGQEDDDFFNQKFVTDPWDGSRKFFVVGRRDDLRPADPVPESVPSPSHRAWLRLPASERTILNYSVSLWSNARSRFTWLEDQPVYEAKLLSTRRNLLDDNLGDDDIPYRTCFVVLEPLRVSAVSNNSKHCFRNLLTQEIDTARYCCDDIPLPGDYLQDRVMSHRSRRMPEAGSVRAARPSTRGCHQRQRQYGAARCGTGQLSRWDGQQL
jgi:endoribonuclease Dicer